MVQHVLWVRRDARVHVDRVAVPVLLLEHAGCVLLRRLFCIPCVIRERNKVNSRSGPDVLQRAGPPSFDAELEQEVPVRMSRRRGKERVLHWRRHAAHVRLRVEVHGLGLGRRSAVDVHAMRRLVRNHVRLILRLLLLAALPQSGVVARLLAEERCAPVVELRRLEALVVQVGVDAAERAEQHVPEGVYPLHSVDVAAVRRQEEAWRALVHKSLHLLVSPQHVDPLVLEAAVPRAEVARVLYQ
mmetsp:Transcript_5731/g.12494  ORF Transcript_5731/g.12494 Transcript_5731/m.12494 type:complete len:243 (+) Transcript_5731:392-1120(+)